MTAAFSGGKSNGIDSQKSSVTESVSNHPLVSFVGAGPGDPELLTIKGARRIAAASLVLYAGSLVPREVVQMAQPEALVLDSAHMTLEETHNLLRETIAKGQNAARVHTGDPSLYGAIQEQIRLLEQDGIDYEIIPGVTAAFAAAARAGLSFTEPEAGQSLILTRMPGRTPMPESERLRDLAAHGCSLAVYLSVDKAGELQNELLAAGLAPTDRVVIAARVGHPAECLVESSVETLVTDIAANDLTRQTIFLIPTRGSQKQSRDSARSKLYDPEFKHGFRS